MYFESFTQFVLMDGHGAFVWSAYAVCLVVTIVCIVQPLRRYRTELDRIASSERAAQGASR